MTFYDVRYGAIGVRNSDQLVDAKEHKTQANREDKFRAKIRKSGLVNETYKWNNVQTAGFVDSNKNKKYDKGEKEGVGYETTVYRFPQSALDDPKFLKFLKKEGYVEVADGGYIYGGKNPEVAVAKYQKEYVDTNAQADAYAQRTKPKKAPDAGMGGKDGNRAIVNILRNHTGNHDKVAKRDDEAVKANNTKKKPKVDTPADLEPKAQPMTASRFESLTLFKNHIVKYEWNGKEIKFDRPPSVSGESDTPHTKGRYSNEGLHTYEIKSHDKETEGKQVLDYAQEKGYHLVRDPNSGGDRGYLLLNDRQYKMWRDVGGTKELSYESENAKHNIP